MPRDIDLKDFRALIRVADAGSISQASVSLGLTQSFLSRVITGLERQLGSPLFYRTGRGVALTDLGEEVVPRARNLVLGCDQLIADVREHGREPAGLVTLALMPTLTGAVAESLFDTLRREHRGITLRMLEGFSASISAWLAEGRADIGLVSRYGKAAQRDEVLSVSDLMLVSPAGRSAAGRTVRFQELAKLALVLPAPPNGTRLAIDRVARRLGVRLRIVVEADSLEAQKALVARQGCATITDPKTFEKEVASGQFEARTISNPRIERSVVISTTTHRPMSRASREVVAAIRRLFEVG
jgi:DNA-binding transcriptional LysR family regulator